MSIPFNGIPSDVRTPGAYIEFDSSRALPGLPGMPHRILAIGQRLSTGSVAEAVPKQVLSVSQAEGFWGRASMLARMCAAAKPANPYTEMWGIALDEAAAGVAATGTLLVAGTATKAGTLALMVGGVRVPVAVASGDTAAEVATAIVAAMTAKTELPVTSAVNGVTPEQVDVTCRWKGETGNAIDMRVNYYLGEELPAGITVTVTPMASGATNPDIATALAALGDVQYNTILNPFTDAANLTALETELWARWGPMVQKEGIAFAAAAGSHATITTLGNSRNSPLSCIMGTGASPTPPWLWAAVLGAVDAAESDPARPRQTLPLVGILPPAEDVRFDRAERNLLLGDGISTYTVDSGGRVLIERLISTYQTNAAGVPDTAYLDVMTPRNLAYQRYTVRAMVSTKYPRHKLASDGVRVAPGQPVVTPSTMRAEMLVLFRTWEWNGLAEGFAQFKKDLLMERSQSDANRLDSLLAPDLMNAFMTFAAQIQFLV